MIDFSSNKNNTNLWRVLSSILRSLKQVKGDCAEDERNIRMSHVR